MVEIVFSLISGQSSRMNEKSAISAQTGYVQFYLESARIHAENGDAFCVSYRS